ncbi:L-type lectin-domain containing receptor kinase IX.1 [Hordeum vulgare]|nr:L-type lectin-domain containing receptor kinase IX.1 [Hordeum vulgare]
MLLAPALLLCRSQSSSELRATAMAVLKLCLCLLLVHHAAAVSFSPGDFRAEDDARITDGRIDLLGDKNFPGCRARGRVLYKQPVQLWDATGEAASFTASFNFTIQSLDGGKGGPGHGMAFFLAPYMPEMPQESYEGCLGLFDETANMASASGSARFVAVEFDTHRDPWDPSSRHIGVDVNSIDSRGNFLILPDDSLVDAGVMSSTVKYDNSTTRLDVVLSVGDTTYNLSATIDLRSLLPDQVSIGFSAATGAAFGSNHTVLSCSFQSTLPTVTTSTPLPSTWSTKLIAGVAAAAVLVLLLGVTVAVLLRRASRRNGQPDDKDMMLAGDMTPDSLDMDDDEFGSSAGPRPIPYANLAAATRNFAEEGKLGQGGSGSVYRGHMKELGDRDVAIKVFSRGASTEGRKEYRSEVTIISRLRHRNLVQLIGWCHCRRRLLLVYELVHNGSLDGYLYSKSKEEVLTWQVRYQITLGLASAVLYLHQEWDQCVVHGDIKPSNIMLDESFNTKLGDFGLSRLIDHGMSLQTMTGMAGTPGYLDPECVITGKASTESDMYSFGVTLLEIVCGRRPMAPPRDDAKDGQVFRLLEWAWDLYGRGAALDAADEHLGGVFDRWEVERVVAVGLWAAHPDPKMRPAIRQAAEALQSRKFRMPVLPPKMPVAVYIQPFAASTMEYSDTTTTIGSSNSRTTATQSSNTSMPAAASEELV